MKLDPKADSDQLRYELDFAVLAGSLVCGHTVRSAGFMNLPGVLIQRASRLSKSARSESEGSSVASVSALSMDAELEDWVLEAGDLITARCSTEGVCAMRRYPGVFVMRGLHCHQALGGRRHERRLYESVIAANSEVIGRSLEELLGLRGCSEVEPLPETLAIPWCVRVLRGYPLAAWRREGEDNQVRPLSPHGDVLQAGDVVLIDAFAEFPSLLPAQRHFLISGLVPKSQAPRHGRATDMWRGIMAFCGLVVALLLDLRGRCHILVSTMVIAGLLFVSSGVKADQISEMMDWNSCLTIGLGEGVGVALRRSGLQEKLSKLIIHIRVLGGDVIGLPLQLCTLSFTAQLAAACISPTPAGLLVANSALAMEAMDDACPLSSKQLVLLIVISTNMVLTVQMPDELMRRRKRAFSVRSLFMWSLPTAVLVAGLTATWTLLLASLEEHG